MRKRKRTGSRLAAVAACLAGLALASAPADKKNQQQTATALIAGTVFRDTGMALAGADVTLSPVAVDSKNRRKPRKIQALTDSRGEFVFRVPAAPSRYTLSVKAAGYAAQEKEVNIAAEERIDVFFHLEAASK